MDLWPSVKKVKTVAEAAQDLCPGRMVSYAEEAEFAAQCLQSLDAHRIMIVTSAYQPRRALAIFR